MLNGIQESKVWQRVLMAWNRKEPSILRFHRLLANTPIFSLPGEEIEECSKRLPNESKRYPEYTIPDHTSIDAIHLLQWRCEGNHR
jgi:hypothetical protein